MRKREESTVNSFTDLEEAIRGLAEEELAEHSHVYLPERYGEENPISRGDDDDGCGNCGGGNFHAAEGKCDFP